MITESNVKSRLVDANKPNLSIRYAKGMLRFITVIFGAFLLLFCPVILVIFCLKIMLPEEALNPDLYIERCCDERGWKTVSGYCADMQDQELIQVIYHGNQCFYQRGIVR